MNNAYKCCYKCPDRQLGCHDTCSKYQEVRAREKAKSETIKNAMAKEHLINGYYKKLNEKLRGC